MDKQNFRSLITKVAFHFLAVVTILVTTAPLFFMRDYLSTSTVALIYLLPVLFSTTVWGLGPGLVSGFFAFLTFNFFFLVPYYTFTVHKTQDITALAIFFIVTLLISQLVGRAKKNLEASMARERELTRLYELSAAIVGVNSIRDIAQVMAMQTSETFRAKSVLVYVNPISGNGPIEFRIPPSKPSSHGEPTTVVPLQTARKLLGEIQIWRDSPIHDPIEERMLRTFANQGALALERIDLAQTETRAKVLEESDKLKSAILSSVSHEFRTPLSTIKAAITSLLSDQESWKTESRNELLSIVNEEADYLNYLVGNLLDMSRIESGVLKPNKQWNVLSEILEGVISKMARSLGSHPINIDIPEELPLVPVDYVQMEQVFRNLISNSNKYAPIGSPIQIQARVQDKMILVQVINDGPPVAPEHLNRIFDKFFRVTHAEKVSGTGLGLSICKGIVEAHGGNIWTENLPNGFAFKFTLPLAWAGATTSAVEPENL